MDILILIGISSVTLIVLLILGWIYTSKAQPKAPQNRPRPAINRQRDGAPRRAQMARNRGARLRANAAVQDNVTDEENEQPDDEQHADELFDGKVGAKKRAKLEAKAEKKAQREAAEHLREEKKKREKQQEEERRKLEEKEKEEEKRKEEEERKAREEKEKREYEEYLKMKEAFMVEEEGFEEGEAGDEQNLLQEFVNYIKGQKVCVLEDLAAHFKLKTQAIIDRIKDLQNDNILTGVIDDRGKFIYISQEEMEAVAKFIKQRGRVSIVDIRENSDKLINLNPNIIVT